MEYILLYPDNHEHLGLFNDLKNAPNVHMFLAGFKNINNSLMKQIRRVHVNWMINQYISLPLKSIWYRKPKFKFDEKKEYCIMVMDGAMLALNVNDLNNIFDRPNVRGVLILINSINAQSISMLESKEKFKKVKWDAIYSFDPKDVITYRLKSLGNCYYSYHDPAEFLKEFPTERPSDVYFTGSIKGNREDLIIKVFEYLRRNGINVNFNLSISGGRRFKANLYEDEINYYTGGWFPYEKVLSGVYRSKVIIEFLQEGQSGPSLRYYEAVCYNKKLLTNNSAVVDLPYYDERYIKVFDEPYDIDLDWIMEDIEVNYHYKNDFSPINMLKEVLE